VGLKRTNKQTNKQTNKERMFLVATLQITCDMHQQPILMIPQHQHLQALLIQALPSSLQSLAHNDRWRLPDGRTYHPYTFSRLSGPSVPLQLGPHQPARLFFGPATFYVSTPYLPFLDAWQHAFAPGSSLRLGNVHGTLHQVNRLTISNGDTLPLHTASPILGDLPNGLPGPDPTSDTWWPTLLHSLLKKTPLFTDNAELLEALAIVQCHTTAIRTTPVYAWNVLHPGHHWKGVLHGPTEALHWIQTLGLGRKTSAGFGCLVPQNVFVSDNV